jgi:transcriptional regulator with XRE-family HTH domain
MSEPNPLAAYLAKRGISRGAFARAVGVKSGVVSRWATGQRVPTVHFALAIARETKGEVPVSAWEKQPAPERKPPPKGRRPLPRSARAAAREVHAKETTTHRE